MNKDILFLLPPGFEDNVRREFCPECAELWGVLHYYPAIKEALEIRYVGIAHPRGPICDLLGEGRWNAPTLVLAEPPSDLVGLRTDNRYAHLGSGRDIAKYFAVRFGTAMPRGS
ncbi:MAG: DUF3088 family protein [Pseudomonadota bacterium]